MHTTIRLLIAVGITIVALVFATTVARSAQSSPGQLNTLLSRAETDFQNGRLTESVAGFDEMIRLAPGIAAQLWQRGIALYYVDRFGDCRAQFESHRTVNPNDVENAVWHFLCVARIESPDRARSAMLPVGFDPRIPMSQIYGMFSGTQTPAEVLAAATKGGDRAQFYAELYLGLYYDALGAEDRALEHILNAASERFSTLASVSYMYAVARVHLDLRQATR